MRTYEIKSYRWYKDDFTLEMVEINTTSWGQVQYRYKFWDNGKLIFSGDDFYSPRHYSRMSDITSLLGFLSLKIGDTDREHFENYTPEQLAWSASFRCDELQYLVNLELDCIEE